MLTLISNAVPTLFYVLFFSVPLILYPKTSELFEFNKMITVYLITAIVVCFWFIKMLQNKKINLKRTPLDIPLILFFASQVISTFLSIDFRTSLLGYYSRFHGGLISTICYLALYWAYVSNMDSRRTLKVIYITLSSAVLVSVYAIAEHFGIDKNIWVQDVQNRVFSTLGQPNWLAAWITALLPITWALSLNLKLKSQNSKIQIKNLKFWLWILLSSLFFVTLLFTKSRSGLLGLATAFVVFWGLVVLTQKNNFKQIVKPLFLLTSFTLFLALLIGTPWSPSVRSILKNGLHKQTETATNAPALEVGGTSSVEIRKIVWKGAINIWRHYPVFGTGVETFAFSYYMYRPVEHNLVSEWDFLYNKAHNEYLNFMATTGTVGILTYLLLIGFTVLQILSISNFKFQISKKVPNPKSQKLDQLEIRPISYLNIALLSGYISILVTNFFGFSVVPVAILFFLFPAISISLDRKSAEPQKLMQLDKFQKLLIASTIVVTLFLVYKIVNYWRADLYYNEGKNLDDLKDFKQSRIDLAKSVELSPKESIFWDELAQVDSNIALIFDANKDSDNAKKFSDIAVNESNLSLELSPNNVNLKRNRARMFINLATINPNYLINAKDTINDSIKIAPTDAKLYYNLALTLARIGQTDDAISTLEKTIELKSDYKNARLALAYFYIDKGEKDKARIQLKYILEKIDPNDENAKKSLEDIKN